MFKLSIICEGKTKTFLDRKGHRKVTSTCTFPQKLPGECVQGGNKQGDKDMGWRRQRLQHKKAKEIPKVTVVSRPQKQLVHLEAAGLGSRAEAREFVIILFMII